jgi:integrase
LSQGRNPGAQKREARAEKQRAALAVEHTFYSIAEKFMKIEGPKLRSANVRRQQLERLIYPQIGVRPIHEIKRSEIVRLLDHVEERSGPAMAQAVLSIVRRTMSWYSARSDDFRSPIVRGMGRVNAKERARERTLTDDEIRRVWRAADAFEGPEGRFTQFLLTTACRRSEASGLRFEELTGSDWVLPAARNKVARVLVRPLSALALRIVDTTPRVSDEFVFSTGARPLAAFSRFKRQLDEASGVTAWTLHDLRRTARSLMARAGVTSEVAERCLGHILGGVEGTYNRHSYIVEMRSAYEKLAALVERIVSPSADNVVSMRG